MAVSHDHNGMVLFGDHQESNMTCTDLHELARYNGDQMTGLKPLRHYMDNIWKVMYQYLEKEPDKWTIYQKAEETTLKSLLKSYIPENPKEIDTAFDKVIFGGLMVGRPTVSVVDRKDACDGGTEISRDVVPRTAFRQNQNR